MGLLTALSALAGCSGAPAKTVTLTGYLYASGGPAPGTTYPVPGTITATNASGTFTATVASDGRYSLPLPPGTYTVIATSPYVTSNARPVRCYPASADTVTVHTAQASVLDVYCPLK